MGRKKKDVPYTGPCRVLIVENDPFLVSLYSTKLSNAGYVVFSSDDGVNGLRIAREEHPDIVLLGILLPRMNGFEVLRSLQEDEATKKSIVIILTNLGEREDIQRGKSLGASEYLIKAHFTPSEVMHIIKKYADIINSTRSI